MEKQTRKNFITAFWKLYGRKPVEKISVRELCETAGYNRTTFYNYYINIYDLLECAVEELTLPAKAVLEKTDDIKSLLEGEGLPNLILFLLKRNNYYMELLMKQHHYYILEEKAKALLLSMIERESGWDNSKQKYIEYMVAYQFSAVFGIVRHWVEAGKDLKDDELVEIAYRLSSRGFLTLIHEEL